MMDPVESASNLLIEKRDEEEGEEAKIKKENDMKANIESTLIKWCSSVTGGEMGGPKIINWFTIFINSIPMESRHLQAW